MEYSHICTNTYFNIKTDTSEELEIIKSFLQCGLKAMKKHHLHGPTQEMFIN